MNSGSVSLFHAVHHLSQTVALALFPPHCAACEAPMPAASPHGLCALCHNTLSANDGCRCKMCDVPLELVLGTSFDTCTRCHMNPPPFTQTRAPYVYGGPLAELIVKSKFREREDIAVSLGRLLAAHPDVQALLREVDFLVPTPLGFKRKWQRGYNQSAIIATCLGKQLGVPVSHALRRTRSTPPQSGLNLDERLTNVRGVFAAKKPLHGRIALIDDVVTSGETARQAALALHEAGAENVVMIAVARATIDSAPKRRHI
jgi:ComF family protein